MICDTMLELMLEADTDELTGQGTSALANHIRTCARCRTVAERLMVDSDLLAVAVRRGVAVDIGTFEARTRFPRRLMIGGGAVAIAASVLMFFFVQRASNEQSDLTNAPMVAHGPEFTPQGVGQARPGDRGGLVPVLSDSADRALLDARRVLARGFAAVTPVHIVPYHRPAAVPPPPARLSQPLSVSNVVVLDSLPASRVSVMQGRDATVTVVWFNSGSSRY